MAKIGNFALEKKGTEKTNGSGRKSCHQVTWTQKNVTEKRTTVNF